MKRNLITILLVLATGMSALAATTIGTIQFKRGTEANLPTRGKTGEPLFSTDTHRVFIGTSSSRIELLKTNGSGAALTGITATQVGAAPIANPTITGTLTVPEINSSSADGTHYIQPYNSVPFSGTPLTGMIMTNMSGIRWYNGSAWVPVSGAVDLSGVQHQPYDHTVSGLVATTIKTAIDELKTLFTTQINALITVLENMGVLPPAVLSLDKSALTFGNVSSASYRTQAFVITNTGFRNLSTGTINKTGTGATKFSSYTACQNKVIAVGGTCTTNVKFTPGAAGDFAASLAINSNDPDYVTNVALSGTGVASLPVYQSAGAIATGATNQIVLSPPSGIQNNDILIGIVGGGYGGNTMSWPAGWTVIQTSTTNPEGTLAWKRASSESGSYTVTGLNSYPYSFFGRVFRVSGCPTSGSPIDASSIYSEGSSTSASWASITTTQANTLVMALSATQNYPFNFSSYTGGGYTWTGIMGSEEVLVETAIATTAGSISITATINSAASKTLAAVALRGM
jgi:hypothetical protein